MTFRTKQTCAVVNINKMGEAAHSVSLGTDPSVANQNHQLFCPSKKQKALMIPICCPQGPIQSFRLSSSSFLSSSDTWRKNHNSKAAVWRFSENVIFFIDTCEEE